MKSGRLKTNKKTGKTPKRGIYILPNLLTSASLFGGFYAIISAIQGRYEAAATAILVSCLFDALDGKIARFTQSTSHFGTEYDSLSDLVAFGVAPAVLVFQWALAGFGRLGWLAGFMYVVCGALRLARFNVQKDTVEANYFKGLPIPAAASLIASIVLFSAALGKTSEAKHVVILVLIYGLSFLMVSTVRYFSFKELDLRKQKPFNFLVFIILLCLVVAYKPRIMLFFVLTFYLLSGPALFLYRFRRNWAAKKAEAAREAEDGKRAERGTENAAPTGRR